MRLDRLLEDVDTPGVRSDLAAVEVSSIAYRSQQVEPGALFCCIPGGTYDGHDFADAAVAAGAVGLLTERRLERGRLDGVPQAVVADTRTAMARVAATFHGHPSRNLVVAGVTGTNGKTTTTHLLAAALSAGGLGAEVIGTLTGPRTTPEAPELQAALAGARARGSKAVVLEVSSHALSLRRVEATSFRMAVFTNLSPEHLDFHRSMEAYFEAKASLFTPERSAAAVVNSDDPWGRRLLSDARIPTTPFALADATDLRVSQQGMDFTWRGCRIHLATGGTFSVANALAAATAAAELGIAADVAAAGISAAAPVPGRFQAIDAGQPFTLVVDYAHTPAGLQASLEAGRAIVDPGRVIVVFGCGGDRDQAKRPVMGEVASRLADRVILTDDNPRGEPSARILADIIGGIGSGSRALVSVEPDRRMAIRLALSEAGRGDLVLVAGKGHETVQVGASGPAPFDDRLVAAEEWARWSGSGGSGAPGAAVAHPPGVDAEPEN